MLLLLTSLGTVAGYAQQATPSATEVEPNETRLQAMTIIPGLDNAVVNAELSNTGDVDYYRFETPDNRSYVIEIFNVLNSGGSIPQVCLETSVGVTLVCDPQTDNGSGNAIVRIVRTLPIGGTFYIRVDTYVGWAGTYSLRVLPAYGEPGAAWGADNEPNDEFMLATPLGLGPQTAERHKLDSYAGIWQRRAERDIYRLQLSAGIRYRFEVFDIEGISDTRRTTIAVSDKNGNRVASVPDTGRVRGGNVDVFIEYTPTTSGLFFVRISNFEGRWMGDYSVRVCERSCLRSLFLPLVQVGGKALLVSTHVPVVTLSVREGFASRPCNGQQATGAGRRFLAGARNEKPKTLVRLPILVRL